ncbi:MAG: hypothetical protein AB1512_26730 [Thermodesulfobacteriota bacterium]
MNDRPMSFRSSVQWYSIVFFLVFLLSLLLTTYVRLSHLSMPLERDEGEYAYVARLILEGVPPFQETYNMKMPGIYYIYAVLMAFLGQSVEGVRLGLLFVNLLTCFTLYFLLTSLYSPLVGCVAVGVFTILSLTPRIQGFAANAEHFVLLPALLGMLFLVLAVDREAQWLFFLAGLMLGVAFVIKQHGLAFLLFGLCFSACAGPPGSGRAWGRGLRNLAWVGSGSVLPFLLMVALMSGYGVFGRFWFWTFTYASRYVTMTSPLDGFVWLRSFMGHLVSSAPIPWILSFAGLLCLLPHSGTARQKGFAAGLLFSSFAAISPGFYYRPHYFILLLPSIGLVSGIALDRLRQTPPGFLRTGRRRLGEILILFLVLASLGHSVYRNRDVFFTMSSAQILRASYGMNPFPEAVEIAKFIHARSLPGDTLAVMGSEPEIYFYARRRAATGYLYTYPLTENHPFAERMQQEMASQIEKAMPRFLVFVGNPFSWSGAPGSAAPLFEWFNRFVGLHYRLVGTVDTLSSQETAYAWDEEAVTYQKRSRSWMDVFERKAGL